MKFSTPAVVMSILALAFSANAQGTVTSASTTSSSGAPAATSALPQCVTQCKASAAIVAGCVGASDLPCICSIKSRTLFQTSVDTCVKTACGADAAQDITAADQNLTSTCLAYASGLTGKSTASSTSGPSSSSNAAASSRAPLALGGARAVGAVLGTVIFGAAVGAAAL